VQSLAKRTGERSFGGVKKVQSNDWLERINAEMPGRPNTQRNLTLASLTEKSQTTGLSPGSTSTSGRRSVRTLPFTKDIFRLITKKFYTHNSIARDISRADIPVFSTAEVQMGEPDGPPYPAYGKFLRHSCVKSSDVTNLLNSIQLSQYQCLGNGSGPDSNVLSSL
jgi:hypothetical protein